MEAGSSGWTIDFPRSKERAPSVKRHHRREFRGKLLSSRVRKNAASLKPPTHGARVWLGAVFPRSKERGLIEAALAV